MISSKGVCSHLARPSSRCRAVFSSATRAVSNRHPEGSERRRASRVGASEVVHLRVGGSYCTARLINLSVDGALVEADTSAEVLGAEVALGFPTGRGDESFWLMALACRFSRGIIGVRWSGQPSVEVMTRIRGVISRELDPLRPGEARLANLRAQALAQGE
jgi:hypothetical protein